MKNALKPATYDVDAGYWTGKAPVYGACAGVDKDHKIHGLPQVSCAASRQELLDYFENTWTITEVLFSGLANDEAYYRRPYHQLRHPMIFYYGHPVSLYINKLRVAGVLDAPLNPAFEALFETGVDEMRWDDLHEGTQEIWPSVAQVRDYRAQAYQLIKNLILTHPLLGDAHLPITQESPMWALVMGFEHERIHIETSSVLIRELPIECVRRPDAWPDDAPASMEQPREICMLAAPRAEQVTLGKPQDYPSFGWDNEYGEEQRDVRPFSASSTLITNAQFHAFVVAGGYSNERFWSREGWAWRRFRNVKWPSFWVQDGPSGSHIFKLRTIFDVVDMAWDWPVCVNYHEAKAYAAWFGEQKNEQYHLLTEAQHHALRGGEAEVNSGLRYGSESPVTAHAPNQHGFYDVFGNVWQWCDDHFHPLQGSKPHPFYDDFSAPCYDGEHQMILGGSFASTGDEASPFARFHFRPHFFQHAGFRLARYDDAHVTSDARKLARLGANPYETKVMVDNYMLMHWGGEHEMFAPEMAAKIAFPQVEHLPLKCAALVREYAVKFDAALDIGCAVGRSSFEMARDFKRVIGIDFSHEFIDAADILRRTGERAYERKESGSNLTPLVAHVDSAIDRTRVQFEQGDACALPLSHKDYNAVLVANVLCRLPRPERMLARMQGENGLVKKSGVLVMTTPFSWLENYTAREYWIEGVEAVKAHLPEFTLIHTEEIPFMIREHARKYEYIITLASVWRRN